MNQEQLIETLNRKGWSVESERNYAWFKLKIKKKMNVLEFAVFGTDFDYKLLIRSIESSIIEEDEFQLLFDFFQKEKEDKPFLLILPAPQMNVAKEERIESYIKRQGYKKIDADDQILEALKATTYGQLYAQRDAVKVIEKYAAIRISLKKVLQTNYEKTLFFDYNENDLEKRKREEFFLNIHHYLANVRLTIETNNIFLSVYEKGIFKEKWEIKHEQEVQMYLQGYINQVEEKQRVRNLFQTHTYFFDKYCALNGVISFFSKYIYDVLLTKYNAKEIERLAALHCKEKKRKERITNNMKYICFFDQKVIMVDRTDLTIKLIEDPREINEHIKEMKKNIS